MKKPSNYLAQKYFKAEPCLKEYWFNLFLRAYFKEISMLCVLVLLISCGGTRQVTTEKHEAFAIENNYSQGTKIILGNTFTYTPFDNVKPMVIEGKIYQNAIISNDKSKTIVKWNDRYITKTIVTEKKKQTEKSDNSLMWTGIALVVALFIFLYFYLPKIKTGIHF